MLNEKSNAINKISLYKAYVFYRKNPQWNTLAVLNFIQKINLDMGLCVCSIKALVIRIL